MSYNGYSAIARVYDKINEGINYSSWADFFEACFEKYCGAKPEIILDLACGTGRMTLELARRGYDMTGVDYSAEMLDRAREAAEEQGIDGVLWLCQDMREFELYGTVEAVVSCLDCINHLTTPADVSSCFSLVHNYLVPDGLFIFDVNGREKFERIYAQNSFVMEDEGSFCVWQNSYNERTKLCDFYITMFYENEDGSYERFDEHQRERMYTVRSIKSLLSANGFELLGVYSDYQFTPADDKSERIYFVAKCVKEINDAK